MTPDAGSIALCWMWWCHGTVYHGGAPSTREAEDRVSKSVLTLPQTEAVKALQCGHSSSARKNFHISQSRALNVTPDKMYLIKRRRVRPKYVFLFSLSPLEGYICLFLFLWPLSTTYKMKENFPSLNTLIKKNKKNENPFFWSLPTKSIQMYKKKILSGVPLFYSASNN